MIIARLVVTMKRLAASSTLSVALLGACASGREFSGELPQPDGALFVDEAYPALLRDCGFVACHGAQDRFFQVYGPGRVRLEPERSEPDDPVTLPEVLHSYDRARSMLATADAQGDSLLLRKPLESTAGGQGHKGVDELGRNVFSGSHDPRYELLVRWAGSAGSPPTAAQVEAAKARAELAKEGTP